MNKDNAEHQKTFKVNEYITLKLENDKTNVYINGKLLHQCRYLLFVNPQLNEAQINITSIDDIEELNLIHDYHFKIILSNYLKKNKQ